MLRKLLSVVLGTLLVLTAVPAPVLAYNDNVKLENVNFYLNLSGALMDEEGFLQRMEPARFTASVCGSDSELHNDLKIVVPFFYEHSFEEAFTVFVNDKSADSMIRNLTKEPVINKTKNTKERYRLSNSEDTAVFPSDEEIFSYLRNGWETGVTNGNVLTVNGAEVNPEHLTTDNFRIVWTSLVDKETEWRIEGTLVPKGGVLTVRAMFDNEEIADLAEKAGYAVTVSGNFLSDDRSVTQTYRYAKKSISESGMVAYVWNFAVFGNEYTLTQQNYTGFDTHDYLRTDYIIKDCMSSKTEDTTVKDPNPEHIHVCTASDMGTSQYVMIHNAYTSCTETVTGVCVWDDESNRDGLRPKSVTVRIWSTLENRVVAYQRVTERNGWRFTFEDLPVYRNGKQDTYYVTEDVIEGYSRETDGYTIYNVPVLQGNNEAH
ncbi:MAG: Cna B-type domain-containing protein [Erysipelotrichaceae bacterium]|nr:Cna B-type domain-containing protein [Erysipelotrichaceae bacterium]